LPIEGTTRASSRRKASRVAVPGIVGRNIRRHIDQIGVAKIVRIGRDGDPAAGVPQTTDRDQARPPEGGRHAAA